MILQTACRRKKGIAQSDTRTVAVDEDSQREWEDESILLQKTNYIVLTNYTEQQSSIWLASEHPVTWPWWKACHSEYTSSVHYINLYK